MTWGSFHSCLCLRASQSSSSRFQWNQMPMKGGLLRHCPALLLPHVSSSDSLQVPYLFQIKYLIIFIHLFICILSCLLFFLSLRTAQNMTTKVHPSTAAARSSVQYGSNSDVEANERWHLTAAERRRTRPRLARGHPRDSSLALVEGSARHTLTWIG